MVHTYQGSTELAGLVLSYHSLRFGLGEEGHFADTAMSTLTFTLNHGRSTYNRFVHLSQVRTACTGHREGLEGIAILLRVLASLDLGWRGCHIH